MRFLLSFLALMAPLTSAILLTSPAGGAHFTKGQKVTVTWTSVFTDPGLISFTLVNFVDFPPLTAILATGIATSAGTVDLFLPCNIGSSSGFQM